MARRLNPKPFGLGFKSPRKQFVWGRCTVAGHCSTFDFHCSALTPLTRCSALTPLTRVDQAIYRGKIADFSPKSPIYRDKPPISRDLSRKIVWPIFLQEKSCRYPSPKYRDIFLLAFRITYLGIFRHTFLGHLHAS